MALTPTSPATNAFDPFFASNLILLTFGIELMFSYDSQILVDDFRHQNL